MRRRRCSGSQQGHLGLQGEQNKSLTNTILGWEQFRLWQDKRLSNWICKRPYSKTRAKLLVTSISERGIPLQKGSSAGRGAKGSWAAIPLSCQESHSLGFEGLWFEGSISWLPSVLTRRYQAFKLQSVYCPTLQTVLFYLIYKTSASSVFSCAFFFSLKKCFPRAHSYDVYINKTFKNAVVFTSLR